MSKIFFDHLIIREDILSTLDVDNQEELEELNDLVDQILLHNVLDLILTQLPDDQHDEFVDRLNSSPHDETHIEFLKVHIPDIEDQIKSHASNVKSDILNDVKKFASTKKTKVSSASKAKSLKPLRRKT